MALVLPHVKRPASPMPCAVTSALAKRARLETTSAAAADAVELTTLLLARAGNDTLKAHPDALIRALESEYSPRVAQLLYRIAGSLDVAHLTDPRVLYDEETVTDESLSAKSVDGDHTVPNSETSLSEVDENDDQLVPDFVPKPAPTAAAPGAALPEKEPAPRVPSDTALVTESHAYNKDTEIALSRIFDLGKVAAVADPSIAPFDPYTGPTVVTMSGFGELGRFGNQVLQYAFLRVYAHCHAVSEVQVPAWVGAGLFGLNDRPVQRAFPAVTETPEAKANSTFTTEFMDYIHASNAGRPVPHVDASDITPATVPGSRNELPAAGVNVDFWGWFQWHTSCYAPYKALIQDIFTPVPALESHMTDIFNRNLRYRGGVKRTVVGLHLRLGDYQNISASSFGYCAPTSWYLELLGKIWHTLENPVLFVASDDIDAVLRDFAVYEPVTADMIGLTMPQEMSKLKAGFFPDWWSLTQCDVLAISNSTFSFSASMMNQRPNARFYRAHYADRMTEIDPWNSDPIVHRDMTRGGLSNAVETLQVLYNTQGTRGVVRNVLYELPYQGIRAAIMKAVLWRNARRNQLELEAKTSASQSAAGTAIAAAS